MNGEVNKLTAMQEIICKIEKEHGWERLYVTSNTYGYRKDGRWYEFDGNEVREV